jgi:hypothetical protein
MKMKRVFVFAHCDDELFCLPYILQKDTDNVIIYLTTSSKLDGQPMGKSYRQIEAERAIELLNRYSNVEVLFFNERIFDGEVHTRFQIEEFEKLELMVSQLNPIELVTLCLEMGHQDHDSVALITQMISNKLNVRFTSFSGYRSSRFLPRMFSVMKPTNPGEKLNPKRSLSLLLAIKLITLYKSQYKTWLGLGPILLVKYAFFPIYTANSSYLDSVPQDLKCFYQERGRSKYSEVSKEHIRFVKSFGKLDD